MLLPDVTEFRFASSLIFDANDKVFVVGGKPVRIVVTGDLVIPDGMLVDASNGVGGVVTEALARGSEAKVE